MHTKLKIPPHLWFGGLWVIDLCLVVPVLRLLGFRIWDGLGREEVPVVLQVSSFHSLVVNLHLIGVVWLDDESVKMSELIVLRGELQFIKQQ